MTSDNVTLVRDGKTLIRGVDYSFAYDPTSNTIRLSPIAGIWQPDREFQIDLANANRTVINFNPPTPADGDTLTVTDLQVPANSLISNTTRAS